MDMMSSTALMASQLENQNLRMQLQQANSNMRLAEQKAHHLSMQLSQVEMRASQAQSATGMANARVNTLQHRVTFLEGRLKEHNISTTGYKEPKVETPKPGDIKFVDWENLLGTRSLIELANMHKGFAQKVLKEKEEMEMYYASMLSWKCIATLLGEELGLNRDAIYVRMTEVRQKVLSGALLPHHPFARTKGMLEQAYGEQAGAKIYDGLVAWAKRVEGEFHAKTPEQREQDHRDRLNKLIEQNASDEERARLKARREEEERLRKEAEARAKAEEAASKLRAVRIELAKSIDWMIFDFEETKSLTHYGDGRRGDVSKFIADFNRDKKRNKGHKTWRFPTKAEVEQLLAAQLLPKRSGEDGLHSFWAEYDIAEYAGGVKQRVPFYWYISLGRYAERGVTGPADKNKALVLVRKRESDGDQPKKLFGLF